MRGMTGARTGRRARFAWLNCALLLPALVLARGGVAAEAYDVSACLATGDTARPPFDALRNVMGADADYVSSEASLRSYGCPDLTGSEDWDVRSDGMRWIHDRPLLWRELWTPSQSLCVVLSEVGPQRALSYVEALILLTASRDTFPGPDNVPPASDFCERIVPADCDVVARLEAELLVAKIANAHAACSPVYQG